MSAQTFRARGSLVIVAPTSVYVERTFGARTDEFARKDIEVITTKRSIYDLPFLEKTVHIRLGSGRTIKVKRMPKRKADELVALLKSYEN